MTRVLVTGANGQLGNEFRRLAGAKKETEFIFTDVDELNITDKRAVNKFMEKHHFNFLINCAAYTAVDKAEDDEEKAYALNADAVDILGRECIKNNVQLIHYSTDFVFDGNSKKPYDENVKPNPLSVYGKSKHAGEICLKKLKTGIIIRTSWLYSSFGNNFVRTILRLSLEKQELRIVNDQIGTPTWAADLAAVTIRIIEHHADQQNKLNWGLCHYSNEGACSWCDFAREIVSLAGLNTAIKPIHTSEYPAKAIRPSYSVLDKSLIKTWLGIEIPGWKDSLSKCINELSIDQFNK
jgi:dTDP-4-dehydrorhamnose reductase